MKEDRDDARRQLEAFFRDDLREAAALAPTFDELSAYAEGRLAPEEAALLEERLADDEAARREVALLRELHGQMSRPRVVPAAPRRTWTWVGLAAAASLVAVASWLMLPGRGPEGDGGPVTTAPATVAAVVDGGERVTLSADGRLAGLSGVDADLRTAAAAALRGDLTAPSGVSALHSGRSTLMGEDGGPAPFGPSAPVGTRVATSRPTFRWSAHAGATAYEVKVFDQDFQEQAASGPVSATEWQPPRPLPSGRVYLWQVTARTAQGRVTAPAPPQPEARFEVAGDALLAQVAQRRRGAPSSHLVGALAFLEAGLLDDADAELAALASANPDAPPVRALRDRLRTLR